MKERKKAGGKKHTLNKLFIPSLLCLAMFPASFAMASASGGEATNNPYDNTYRNLESASGNRIELVGETGYNYVFGGYENSTTDNTVASNNTVTLSSGSEVKWDVYGGYANTENETGAATATASNNTVTITGTTVGRHIYGGRVNAEAYGENARATATASNNTVTITGTTVGRHIYGGRVNADAYGENTRATATASNNTVTITGSTVGDDVYGGYADAYAEGDSSSATATASNNTVTITGSTVNDDLYAGDAVAYAEGDSSSATATASNNTVTITDSTVNDDVYGGYADAWGATQSRETASYNTVTIDSSTVAAGNRIAGGVVYVDDENNTVTATYNTVNLKGDYDVTGVSLYGGYDDRETGEAGAGAGSDLFTGNTLNLDARNIEGATSVGEVANFETINIRAGNVENGDTILDTDGTMLGNEDGSKGTTVKLLTVESKDLQSGDTLTLISRADGVLANDGETQFVKQGDGVATGYDALISLNEDDGSVGAEFTSDRKINPETKVLSESRAASMALLNSGTDLLIANAAMESNETQSNLFGAIRGGHIRNKTGSSIEVDGVSLLTGVSHTIATGNGNLKAGAFIEAGWGDTATKNAIGGNKQRGEGKSNYYGAGLMGRYTLQNGIYTEGSIRMGKLDSDYHNSDVRNRYGKRVSYDTDNMYYGAHLGVGYQWKLSDAFSLDTSAKYMWARVDSDSVSILGERYHFDSMNSHRTRLGARLDYTANPQYTPYIGVAWEHEFDGEAGGRVEGYKLDEADAGGSSGIVMLGVDFKPTAGSPFTLNAGVTGYFGQNEGVAGQFKMNYAF